MQTKTTETLFFITAIFLQSYRVGTRRRKAEARCGIVLRGAIRARRNPVSALPIQAGDRQSCILRATLHPANQCSGSFLNLQIVSIP